MYGYHVCIHGISFNSITHHIAVGTYRRRLHRDENQTPVMKNKQFNSKTKTSDQHSPHPREQIPQSKPRFTQP